jgi:hypothetical protein
MLMNTAITIPSLVSSPLVSHIHEPKIPAFDLPYTSWYQVTVELECSGQNNHR